MIDSQMFENWNVTTAVNSTLSEKIDIQKMLDLVRFMPKIRKSLVVGTEYQFEQIRKYIDSQSDRPVVLDWPNTIYGIECRKFTTRIDLWNWLIDHCDEYKDYDLILLHDEAFDAKTD